MCECVFLKFNLVLISNSITQFVFLYLNAGRSNVWCLYPNKNAVLESVENAFGQEPVANYEVTPEKVCFNVVSCNSNCWYTNNTSDCVCTGEYDCTMKKPTFLKSGQVIFPYHVSVLNFLLSEYGLYNIKFM